MRDTKREHDSKNTGAAYVAAHRDLEAREPDTYAALMAATLKATRALDDDAASAAALQVASLYRGSIAATVARAVRNGRAVAAATSAVAVPADDDTLDGLTTGKRYRITFPSPEDRYRITAGDLARAIAGCMADTPHAAIWRDSCRALMRHGDGSRCRRCQTVGGRLPTLATILAHTRGVERDTGEHKSLTRAMRAALADALPRVADILTAYADARPRAAWDEGSRAASTRMAALTAARLGMLLADARIAVAPLPTFGTTAVETVETIATEHVPARPVMARGSIPRARLDAATDRHAALVEREDAALRMARYVGSLAWDETLAELLGDNLSAAQAIAPDLPSVGTYVVGHTSPHDVTRAATRRMPVVSPMRALLDAPEPRDAREPGDLRSTSDPSPVTVRTPDGHFSTRDMTDEERDVCRASREREGRWAGEQYGADTSRGRNVPDPHTGQVPTGKRPVSPRKRSAGTTGPTVPAWRAH